MFIAHLKRCLEPWRWLWLVTLLRWHNVLREHLVDDAAEKFVSRLIYEKLFGAEAFEGAFCTGYKDTTILFDL